MKRSVKWLLTVFCTLLLLSSFPVTAWADTGPKAAVTVTFENVGDELCYGTLLSETKTTGRWVAWDGSNNAHYTDDTKIDPWCGEAPYDIWKAFVDYEDADGFYFLQLVWTVSETGEIAWSSYPPDTFKVLLYYPESGRFVVSGIQQRYAFHARYRVDLRNGAAETLRAVRAFSWSAELPSFLFRVALTLAVELGIALLFRIRKRKQLLFIVAVNVITQLLLNLVFLFTGEVGIPPGVVFLLPLYLPGMELGIVVLEALAYCLFLNKYTDEPRRSGIYILYAVAANIASLALGCVLSFVIPGMF